MIWGWKWIETNLKIPNQESWPQGIIQSKEETTVHKDSNTSNVEATIKSSNTIRCICLPVNINKTIELPFSTLLYIISQTSSGIVEAVDKQKKLQHQQDLYLPTILIQVNQTFKRQINKKLNTWEKKFQEKTII